MEEALQLEVAALSRTRNLQLLQSAGTTDIQRAFSGKTIFITGATGFLGKQLIEKLLRSCCDIKKIYMLVRNKKGKDVNERAKELISEVVYDELRKCNPHFGDKLCAIEGDTSELELAMNEKDKEILKNEIDIIFHAAATVRFDEPLKKAILTNVRGTREVLDLAVNCKKLCAFIYVSTAYSHCPKSEIKEEFYPSPVGWDLIIRMVETTDEEIINNITAGLIGNWPNTYAFSKAIAEDLVKQYATQIKIPIAVTRPAVVVPTCREPMPGWMDISNVFGPTGVFLGVGLGLMHCLLVDPRCQMDLVPVDYVNNFIIAAAYDTITNKDQEPKVYNYTSTNRNRFTWGDVRKILETKCKSLRSPRQVWYSFAYQEPNRLLYTILTLLWHTIPAYILDFGAILLGKKPMIRKLYTKMHKLMDVLSSFSLREWKLHESNVQNLFKSLSDRDKELFNFDIAACNWPEFIQLWSLGIRKYIVKDGLKNTELGIKKNFYFRIGHYAVVLLYVFVFWNLISFSYWTFKTIIFWLNKIV